MDFNIDFFDNELNSKTFNTAGICLVHKHYMVDITLKLKKIIRLVQNESYFVMNRPRQYGKTTTLNTLEKILKTKYEVISIDFELLGEDFKDEKRFCNSLIKVISESLSTIVKDANTLTELSEVIKAITKDKEIILIIDEVDRNSNNLLFLNFLGILRSLYLGREREVCTTFKAVILSGVYDIKNLKLKFKDESEIRYNSPWNIAVNFDVDMSFNSNEISTMLNEYNVENNLTLNIEEISETIYKFTSGYPFLVSRLCQIIDENILKNNKRNWNVSDVERAVKIILMETNTLFDDLIKNLENNKELYDTMKQVILGDSRVIYNPYNPSINLGIMFGYFSRDDENYIKISNLIFSELILDYITSKLSTKGMGNYNIRSDYLLENGGLDIKKILVNFKKFMISAKEKSNNKFLEDDGRLLLSAFMKPIINGTGFFYREVRVENGKRLDLVVQYGRYKYIIELKLWNGEKYHEEGKSQLANYLNIENLDTGYLVIFDFREKKENHYREYKYKNKSIFEIFI